MVFSLGTIAQHHFDCIKKDLSPQWKVWIYFGAVPVIISSVLVSIGLVVTKNFLSLVVPMLSILVGFSINAIVILIDTPDGSASERTRELVFRTRSHTLYAVVFGLALIALSGFHYLLIDRGITTITMSTKYLRTDVRTILSLLFFFAIVHYLFTLYLLPARIYAVIEHEE